MPSTSKFSRRSAVSLPARPAHIAAAINDASKDFYDKEKNPNGVINLGTAENSLLQDWLVKEFKENFNLETRELNYQPFDGPSRFKDAMCMIMNRYFQPARPIQPEHVVSACGVTAILAQLVYALCDPEDGILVSKPYYSGFDHLIKQGVQVIGFEIEDPLNPIGVSEALERAYHDQLHSHQRTIKAIILCNPHNPLGYCISKEVLITYFKFCERYDLHLIVDEIYGLTFFGEAKEFTNDGAAQQAEKFISTLSLNPPEFGCDPSRLYVVYGISKDFGCCGLRAGILIAQNDGTLLTKLKDLNLNQVQVSTLTESVFSSLILDKPALGAPHTQSTPSPSPLLESYLALNRALVRDSYQSVTAQLNQLKIPFCPANAGLFLMIDLSKYCSAFGRSDQENEQSCFLKLIHEFKLYLTPGSFYHCPKSGFFRLVFTVPRDQLELGLERLARFIESFDSNSIISIASLNLSKETP